MAKEKALLKRWGNYIGGLRPDQIKRVHVNRFKQLSVVLRSHVTHSSERLAAVEVVPPFSV